MVPFALPIAAELLACHLPSSILIVLQLQVQELNLSQHRNEISTKWRGSTVKTPHTFSGSETVGEGVGLVGLRT